MIRRLFSLGSWHPESKARAHRVAVTARRILLLTLGAYVFAVGAGASVRAEVEDRMMALGAGLAEVERTMPDLGAERVLVLNGARLVMVSGADEAPVGEILDRFQRYCAPERVAGDQDDHDDGEPLPGAFLRRDEEGRGFVACLDALATSSTREIVSALREMSGGDLSAAGNARYFYAERRGQTTFYIAVTLEAGLDLGTMFPAEGDVPGLDVPGIDRPNGSRRVLSAHQEGEPYQMLLYTGAGATPDQLYADYRGRLEQGGWRILEPRNPSRSGARTLFAERGGWMVALIFANETDGASMTVLTGL